MMATPDKQTEQEQLKMEPEAKSDLEDSRDDWQDLSKGTQYWDGSTGVGPVKLDRIGGVPFGQAIEFTVNGEPATQEEWERARSPLLYDRITGAGPYIDVTHERDLAETVNYNGGGGDLEPGQHWYYRGENDYNNEDAKDQNLIKCFPLTLTAKRPYTPDPGDTVTKEFHDGKVKYLNGLVNTVWDRESVALTRTRRAENRLSLYNGILAFLFALAFGCGLGELVIQLDPQGIKTSAVDQELFVGESGTAYLVPPQGDGVVFYEGDGLLKMGDSDTQILVKDTAGHWLGLEGECSVCK